MNTYRFLSKFIFCACALAVLAGCSAQPAPLASSQAPESAPPEPLHSAVQIFAGTLLPGTANGDNAQAQFIKPYGLCAASDGSLLIVDSYANQLRLADKNGVTALVGNADTLDAGGFPLGGYVNGSANAAFLNRPRFAVVSEEGAVVFSDTGNHRIRVLADGAVYLLAGDGTAGFQNGDYKAARFNTPSGVAIGADGTIYVADTLNHCIRTISPQGEVATLAGVPQQAGFADGTYGEALFCEPNDLQLGPDGALYVVDKGNQRIRRIAQERVTTVAGCGGDADATTGYIVGGYYDGPAEQAQFQYPTGLFVAQDGSIYVADTGNNCIRKISPDGLVTTVSGARTAGSTGGDLTQARFNQPLDVFLEGNILFVSDSYNHVIRSIQLDNQGKDAAEI